MTSEPARRAKPWRRWNAATHRDVGYVTVALTLAYAISGLAVNHIASWNPNYAKVKEVRQIQPLSRTDPTEVLVRAAQAQLKPEGKFKSAFQPDDDTLQLYYEPVSYTHLTLPTKRIV